MVQVPVDLSFTLKCGAEVSGEVHKWVYCKDPDCVNCNNAKSQQGYFSSDDKGK